MSDEHEPRILPFVFPKDQTKTPTLAPTPDRRGPFDRPGGIRITVHVEHPTDADDPE